MISGMRASTSLLLLGVVLTVPALRLAGLVGPSDASATPDASSLAVETPIAAAPEPAPTIAPTVAADGQPASTSEAAPAPVVTSPPTTTAPVPTVASTTAHVRGDGLDVFHDPSATQPTLHLAPATEFGTPRVLLVVGSSVDPWLQVLVPVRPNNAVGWIRAQDVDLTTGHDELQVSLRDRSLQWVHDTTVVLRTPIAIGAASSPTPPGRYFVTDVLPSGGGYGPFILALNGHSDTFTNFGGGDARLAVHGTNDPASIGSAASHGCVRLPNALITRLASTLPPGTPVVVA
jgi:lipoprotein-anchoring transpeptidase ErfK/SrfK